MLDRIVEAESIASLTKEFIAQQQKTSNSAGN